MIAGFRVIVGDQKALGEAHRGKIVEFCLERELATTSPSVLEWFSKDVCDVFPALKPDYIFAGCILLGFKVPAEVIESIERQIESGAADRIIAKYGVRSVTIFCSLTSQHHISFR